MTLSFSPQVQREIRRPRAAAMSFLNDSPGPLPHLTGLSRRGENISLNERLLAGKTILVLEDEYLIAMDVEQLCREGGANEVHIARSLREAGEHESPSHGRIDLAVLDVMLAGEPTLDFAEDLRSRGIPFIFATGYGDSARVSIRFPDAPIVGKPYTAQEIISAMTTALAGTRSSGDG